MVHGVECFAEVHGKYADFTAAPIIQIFTNMVLDQDERICTAAHFPVGKLLGLKFFSMIYCAWVRYTTFSNALEMTGMILMPRKSEFSTGMLILGRGQMLSLFQASDHMCVAKDRFQSGVITGTKNFANSFLIQEGVSSGPVAFFFTPVREFQTSLSEISGASPTSAIRTSVGRV